jgi:thiol-disulfide isomerase/thioredoxin
MSVNKSIARLLIIGTTLLSVSSCAHNSSKTEDYLVGPISQETLFEQEQRFKEHFSSSSVSQQDKALITSWPKDLHIDIYFGTWCHDSQREVPQILSILQHNSDISYKLIALDIEKSDPQQLATKHQVKYTPTFIIYKGKKEVGRIVERPNKSLVKDITELTL